MPLLHNTPRWAFLILCGYAKIVTWHTTLGSASPPFFPFHYLFLVCSRRQHSVWWESRFCSVAGHALMFPEEGMRGLFRRQDIIITIAVLKNWMFFAPWWLQCVKTLFKVIEWCGHMTLSHGRGASPHRLATLSFITNVLETALCVRYKYLVLISYPEKWCPLSVQSSPQTAWFRKGALCNPWRRLYWRWSSNNYILVSGM